MNQNLVLTALLLLLLSWTGLAPAAVPAVEVTGTIEQWSPAERIITLNGKRYQLSESARITHLDQEKLLETSFLHIGATVTIEEIEGIIYALVILPRGESTMHQNGQ